MTGGQGEDEPGGSTVLLTRKPDHKRERPAGALVFVWPGQGRTVSWSADTKIPELADKKITGQRPRILWPSSAAAFGRPLTDDEKYRQAVQGRPWACLFIVC